MAQVVQLVNPLGSREFAGGCFRPCLLPRPNPSTQLAVSRRCSALRFRRAVSRVWCSNLTDGPGEAQPEEDVERKELPILLPWDVPWDWKVTAFVMMPYLMSIVLSGVVESAGLAGVPQPFTEKMHAQIYSTDEQAMRMFVDQLLKTVVKLSVLYMFVSPHRPFPDDIFSFRWGQPFNIQKGWILWAGGGLLIAISAVFVKACISGYSSGQIPNETEALARFLPLIGSSSVSTVCLLGILGFLTPICEELLYRGFLMTTLTKWFPLPISVAISSAVFALGHQSPGKSIDIFIFGIMLGLVYAQTRNLLAPITLHAWWNSGVILLLTYLHSQGHDIQKYVL